MDWDWVGDYLSFCWHGGYGGWVLLAITGFAVLLVVLGVLAGIAQMGRAFARGWRSAA